MTTGDPERILAMVEEIKELRSDNEQLKSRLTEKIHLECVFLADSYDREIRSLKARIKEIERTTSQ